MFEFIWILTFYEPVTMNDVCFDSNSGTVWVATDRMGVFSIKLSEYTILWEMKDKTLESEYREAGWDDFIRRYPEYETYDHFYVIWGCRFHFSPSMIPMKEDH